MKRATALLLLLLVIAGIACRPMATDNYDLELKEEPTCQVYVQFNSPAEAKEFITTLKHFAEQHSISESPMKVERAFSAPQFPIVPLYHNENLIISTMTCIAPEDPYGQSRISVLRRSYRMSEFKTVAEEFRRAFEDKFTNRVRFDFDQGPK